MPLKGNTVSGTRVSFVDKLDIRARRPGLTGVASNVKLGVKKLASRAARATGKHTLQRELQDLVAIPAHEALLDDYDLARVSYTPSELEAMADALLDQAEKEAFEVAVSIEDEARALPLELLGGLPDWLLGSMEAANGDAFTYLSLLEEKRPRKTVGLLAEELAEAA